MDEIIVSGAQRFDRVAHAEIHGAPGMPRTTTQAGSTPTDIVAMVDLGADTRHCVIHDVHNVFWGAGHPASGLIFGTMYDVRVYNIGWKTLDPKDRTGEAGGHGQAIYIQCYGADGQKVIDTCVFAAGFSWMKIYGTNGEIKDYNNPTADPAHKLSNVRIRRTVFVGKSFLVGGTSYGAHNIEIEDCTFLDCGLLMGYRGQNGDGKITGCLLTRGVVVQSVAQAGHRNAVNNRLTSWRQLEFTGNVIIIPRGASVRVTHDSPEWVWNENTYYSEEPRPFVLQRQNPDFPKNNQLPFMLPDERLTFAEWQAATGFDAGSTYHEGLPSAPMVREYAVEGLGKRVSNVAVYNPLRVVEVSLPDGWTEAKITHMLNPSDVAEESVIYMNGSSALPEGWTGGRVAPLPDEILPTYEVFRLEEIEDEAGGDDAAAKIAALEARLVEREARITEQAAQLGKLTIEVFEMGLGISNRDKRIGEMSARIEVQQKIIDTARALWEASTAFGAIMEVKP